MERYLKIAKANFKFNLLPHLLVALIFCLIAPLILGVENLDKLQTAKVLEIYISLIGIILLVPLFIPYEDNNIRDLIKSKKESIINVYIVGILQVIIILTILLIGFLYFLDINSCEFPFNSYLYGTMANCIFLGGLGILAYGIIDNLPVGYMVPMIYYIICFSGGKHYLGKLYLFSMMEGNIEDKKYLLIAGIVMIILGVIVRSVNIQIKGRKLSVVK